MRSRVNVWCCHPELKKITKKIAGKLSDRIEVGFFTSHHGCRILLLPKEAIRSVLDEQRRKARGLRVSKGRWSRTLVVDPQTRKPYDLIRETLAGEAVNGACCHTRRRCDLALEYAGPSPSAHSRELLVSSSVLPRPSFYRASTAGCQLDLGTRSDQLGEHRAFAFVAIPIRPKLIRHTVELISSWMCTPWSKLSRPISLNAFEAEIDITSYFHLIWAGSIGCPVSRTQIASFGGFLEIVEDHTRLRVRSRQNTCQPVMRRCGSATNSHSWTRARTERKI